MRRQEDPVNDEATASTPWRRNLAWSAGWIALALAFGGWIALTRGSTAAAEYYAAYLLEKALSIDNIFVFVIIFSELKIPARYQRRGLRGADARAPLLRAAGSFSAAHPIHRSS